MRTHPAPRGLIASGTLVVLAVSLGAGLRLAQAALRWDEVALAYAAYTEPVARALADRDPASAVASWIGLHPPLHALVMAVIEWAWPAPVAWLLFSVAASVGAVWLVGRAGGPLAALVLATAPLQISYAAEVNNYPLAIFAVAAVLAAARGPWWLLALASVLAGWSHLMAGAMAAGVVLWRLRQGPRLPLIAAVALGWLPLAAGVWRLLGQGSTFSQPALDVPGWGAGVAAVVGVEGLVISALAARGLRAEVVGAWVFGALFLGVALLVGAAAPHQWPYLALLGPPVAVAVGRGLRRPWLVALVVGLCLARGGRQGGALVGRLGSVLADQAAPRGIDAALADSAPGDTLWLVAPALQPDDDKTASSPVLWRLRPWVPMPMARPVPFEYRDWRFGQPRTWRGRTVHTSTELYPAPFDSVARAALGRGRRVIVVLYEYAPATGLRARVDRVLRPYTFHERVFEDTTGLGADRVFTVTGVHQ